MTSYEKKKIGLQQKEDLEKWKMQDGELKNEDDKWRLKNKGRYWKKKIED